MANSPVSLCALAGAAALALFAAPAAADTLKSTLSGPDPDGTGTATVTIKGEEVCYELSTGNIAVATAAHIHKAPAGASGPPVVPMVKPDEHGKSAGCSTVTKEVAADIAANPAGYYVNVHNAEHPAGAIRGQLTK